MADKKKQNKTAPAADDSATPVPTLSADPDNVPQFSLQEFQNATAFKWLAAIDSPFRQEMLVQIIDQQAQNIGFKNFPSLWRKYKREQSQQKKHEVIEQYSNRSDINGQTDPLDIGDWHANTTEGVWRYAPGGVIVTACSHPILPVSRTRSIDTGAIKYTLMWYRHESEHPSFTEIDGSDMLSATEIVKKLSPYGVSVSTGDRAKALVDYLRDVTDRSYNAIPEKQSVSRLGWTKDGQGFAPYVPGIDFDGAIAFGPAYAAITQRGSYDAWLTEAKDARTYSTIAKVILAASFAAPLVEKLGVLPFFVHIWSAESGTGKTVGQMLGASVWGDPAPGGPYFPTFRSTSVGIEMMAGFLHSLPLFLDELQLAKDNRGEVRFNVYELASGTGKLRSNRQLGLNYTPTWANCFITSGETQLVKDTDGEGAINRVLEIECGAGDKVINDGLRTANALRQNYGWAGRQYIQRLQSDGEIDRARELYMTFYRKCLSTDTTEKQAMAAAVLLTADALASEYIFNDGNGLTAEELSGYLKERERVSLMERGYEVLCDWVSINANKLRGYVDGDKSEVYGLLDADKGIAYITRSVFAKVCQDNGLSMRGLLSHLRSKGLIDTPNKKKGFTITTRLSPGREGARAECIWLHLPENKPENDPENDENEGIPF